MGNETREEILGSMILELRRGSIVLSVLSRLGEPKYGYDLIHQLEEKGITIDTSTLYPLLRRLEKQGLLVSEWITAEAKPRKYYRRTPMGDSIYSELKLQWQEMTKSLNALLEE